MRGATRPVRGTEWTGIDFNPRSPCGERRKDTWAALDAGKISIHAPRAGSDQDMSIVTAAAAKFQSTLPVRGATIGNQTTTSKPKFQSTLPVRGATTGTTCGTSALWYFNPRSPCGERPEQLARYRAMREISIHAPRAGSDSAGIEHLSFFSCFFFPMESIQF